MNKSLKHKHSPEHTEDEHGGLAKQNCSCGAYRFWDHGTFGEWYEKPPMNKFKDKKKKEIYDCCFDCGKKYGKLKKGAIGVWVGECDICGKSNVACASAPHDFGIYSSKEIEVADKIQRLI